MGVDLVVYRSKIGVFALSAGGGRTRIRFHGGDGRLGRRGSVFLIVIYLFLLLRAAILLRHGDIERNPGPVSTQALRQTRSQGMDG